MRLRHVLRTLATVLAVSTYMAIAPAHAATLSLWTFWGDQGAKRDFIEHAVKAFEAAHPGDTVQVSWYDKNSLYAALKTALRAGQGPDVFYAEVDQVEYIDNGLLLDLSNRLNWGDIEPWAKQAWTFGKGTYGLPLEAWTVELYYNTKLLHELGFNPPANHQFDQKTFLALIKAAHAKDITPIALGVGDRPYPGAFLTEEALLKEVGAADYGKLMRGELKWSDPRVVKALTYVKSLIDTGALPKSFSTLKLGESHAYFYSKPGSVMFLMGSFYPSRAFNPPNQGGQPPDFPLGIMQYPALDNAACNECKTMAVGGSYVVNAATKHADLAVAFLNTMATPAMGKLWVETVMGQTGIKTDMAHVSGPHAGYFKELAAVNDDAKYFFGLPSQVMQGKRRDAFTQIINQAFPAGILSVQQVVDRMDAVQ